MVTLNPEINMLKPSTQQSSALQACFNDSLLNPRNPHISGYICVYFSDIYTDIYFYI